MAKVRNPLLSLDASGSFGDTIYSKNQYGAYAYPKPTLPASDSGFQHAWRENLKSLWNYWSTNDVTHQAIRDSYNNFALQWPIKGKYGETQFLTGFDWFFKFNCWFYISYGYHHDTAPLSPVCSFNPSHSIYQNNTGIHFLFYGGTYNGEGVVLGIVPPQNLTRFFCPNLFMDTPYSGFQASGSVILWLNASLTFAMKRYFFRYHFIDIQGRPSTTLFYYIDARQLNLPDTAVCSADTMIVAATPTTNYGSATELYCQELVGYHRKSLLKFDLSAFGSDWVASECKLWVYCNTVTNAGNVYLHEILVPWVELEATWIDASSGVMWGSNGMQSGVDYKASSETHVSVSTAGVWYSFTITTLFNQWVAGSVANHGVVLIAPTADTYVIFLSRNYATPSFRPYLEITWAEL